LVLEAPYTSMVAMAKRIYPFLPVSWLLFDRYETERHITGVTMPILILHGVRDELIPVSMGRDLAHIAGSRATLVELPNGYHNDLFEIGNDAIRHVRAFAVRLGFQ
jgi:hypothetical protein